MHTYEFEVIDRDGSVCRYTRVTADTVREARRFARSLILPSETIGSIFQAWE